MVSIITVNYNQTAATCALLDSIRRQEYRQVEIIVIDNGSVANPELVFATHYPEVVFIRSEHNLGFAGGNNLALRKAGGDFLFFVNNDAELTNGCIAALLEICAQRPDLGIVSPLICYFPEYGDQIPVIQYAGMTPINPWTGRNRTIGNGTLQEGQYNQAHQTAYAHGAAMFVPRPVLDQVGPMTEDFFLYYEELDWCERIRRVGFSIWVAPEALVFHKESLTVQKMGALKTYYLTRNRIWFMRRNFGILQRMVFYLFVGVVVIPKHLLFYAAKSEKENSRAFWQAIRWNFGHSDNEWEAARNTLTTSSKSAAPIEL